MKRAFTLTEILIYAGLALVAGVILASVIKLSNSTRQATSSSYLVSGSTETAIAWLRRDINETALTSIQVYPNADVSSEAPGLSLVSARAYDPALKNRLLVNPWGAPRWDKFVFYTLETNGEQTGDLVRWERNMPNKNYLPAFADMLPGTLAEAAHRRVLLSHVLAPEQTVEGVGPEGSVQTDAFGGFRAQFVARQGGSGGEEYLTTRNPRRGDPRDNTRLLEVEFKLLHSGQRHPDYYAIKFRAAARY